MTAQYTNAARFIDHVLACAREVEAALDRAASLEAESVRIGGSARLSPVFFVLDPETGLPTETLRVDMGCTLDELNLALSSLKVLSGGTDNGLAGLAAQVQAARAALDKIKR